VLSSPDYSRIVGWEIPSDLNSEVYQGDSGFDPRRKMREGQIFCYGENKNIWCEELFIDLGKHKAEALRRVDARFRNLRQRNREPAESRVGKAIESSPTQIIGNYLVYNWSDRITEAYGRVLAIQPEKDVEADNVIYYEESDAIHAWGDVIVHQYSGRWWESSGALEEITVERLREEIRKPSVLTADAVLAYNERVSWAFGNVVFRQTGQIVSGERAQYEDANEILVLAGKVNYSSEKGEKLQCALLTMDLRLEEYIAEGGAIARTIVPEEYREDLKEYRGEREIKPGEDARTRLLERRTAEGLGDWTEAIENPPPPPPIEVLPDVRGRVERLPPLGPEVPPPQASSPPSFSESEEKPESDRSVAEPEAVEISPEASTEPEVTDEVTEREGSE